MPIGLDPTQTAPYVLRRDREGPEEDRPTFLFHFLTRAEVRRAIELRERARQERDNDASERLLDECILIGLAGWRNINDRRARPIPFESSSDRLDEALTLVEKWELANNYPAALQNAEIEMRRPRPSGANLPDES
jgi:hypothetical protein